MSIFILRAMIFIASICICSGQDTTLFKAGVNLFGLGFNTIDLELQYTISPHIYATFSGGYQYNMRVIDLKNSSGTRASGSFIRGGIIFITSKPENRVRYFLKGELIISNLNHRTNFVFKDHYEEFSIPIKYYSNYFGGALGHGLMFYISDKFEVDFYGMAGFTKNKNEFVTMGYTLPGFYLAYALFYGPANTFIRPGLSLKYRFKTKERPPPIENE